MAFPSIDSIGAVSRYIDIDGLRTHYIEVGRGAPLVLVHGGGAGADAWGNWYGCLKRYADDYRAIAYDMPGFGLTDKPDPSVYDYSQESRNRHLAALLRALRLPPVNIIGNSMGGATSLGVAISEPKLIRKMVLMGSAGLAISNPDPQFIKQLREYDFTLEGMRRIMRVLTGPGFKLDEDLVEYRHALMHSPEARAATKAITRTNLTYERERIASVKTPTLVVGGKRDQIAVPARTYGYLELLENSWGFMFPHCGHWVMMEAPEEFATITCAFFRDTLFNPAPG